MRLSSAVAVFLVLALGAGRGSAADFPQRPVRIITPYAVGGGIDILTRSVAQRMGVHWREQVIVENRPGAGATIGHAQAAKAPADGYTLLAAANPLGIGPVVYPNLPYDALRDFIPIGLFATTLPKAEMNGTPVLASSLWVSVLSPSMPSR